MKSIMWCYCGENNDQVMMTCSKEDWEAICKLINRAAYRNESDEWNYSYTIADRRR